MLEADIHAALTGDAGITALVGSRVYGGQAPAQTDAPYIMWQVISGRPEPTHDAVADITTTYIQFSAFATTYAGAIALSERALAVLLNAGLGLSVFVETHARDTYEAAAKLHRRDFDLTFWQRLSLTV